KMPRLPTIRVIGSQFISTMFPCGAEVPLCGAVITSGINISLVATLSVKFGFVSSGQFAARMTPLWFFVDGAICDRAQSPKNASPHTHDDGRKCRSRRRIHERHEFVGETGHGAADANSADVRTTADAVHPTALGHIAINNGAPTANFHQALGRAIFLREIGLLIITGPIASLVHGFTKQPGGPQLIVERNDRRKSGDLVEKIQQRLHHVVWLHGTTRDIYTRQAGLRFPIPAEVVAQSHRACGISFHGMDAAVSRAGPTSN